MASRALITGGAGFIGSHTADELLAAGWRVRILDSFLPQVHRGRRPAYLSPEIEVVAADIRDGDAVRRALVDVDAVCHFAAMVGVGQSMYQVADYTAVNDLGTAVLLQALLAHPVERLVVASSMSIYGEGLYRDRDGCLVTDAARDSRRLADGLWDPVGPDGASLVPVPTPEGKTPSLASVYALSKYVQERMCLVIGEAYGMRTTALRLFNVYGPRQALSNPYTGVLAIFASRLLNHRSPLIFEDGGQRRDFVHVTDVARAVRLALDNPAAAGRALNIGSGQDIAIRDIAHQLAAILGCEDLPAEITGRCRAGDVRHCFADISEARAVLGYAPRTPFASGLAELAVWLAGQAAEDRVEQATAELASRGLVK